MSVEQRAIELAKSEVFDATVFPNITFRQISMSRSLFNVPIYTVLRHIHTTLSNVEFDIPSGHPKKEEHIAWITPLISSIYFDNVNREIFRIMDKCFIDNVNEKRNESIDYPIDQYVYSSIVCEPGIYRFNRIVYYNYSKGRIMNNFMNSNVFVPDYIYNKNPGLTAHNSTLSDKVKYGILMFTLLHDHLNNEYKICEEYNYNTMSKNEIDLMIYLSRLIHEFKDIYYKVRCYEIDCLSYNKVC